jgi:hypothetical protein
VESRLGGFAGYFNDYLKKIFPTFYSTLPINTRYTVNSVTYNSTGVVQVGYNYQFMYAKSGVMRSLTFLKEANAAYINNCISFTPIATTTSIIIDVVLTGVVCESANMSFLTFVRVSQLTTPFTVTYNNARIEADAAYNPNIGGTEISIIITLYTPTTNPSFTTNYNYLVDMPPIPLVGSSAYYN